MTLSARGQRRRLKDVPHFMVVRKYWGFEVDLSDRTLFLRKLVKDELMAYSTL